MFRWIQRFREYRDARRQRRLAKQQLNALRAAGVDWVATSPIPLGDTPPVLPLRGRTPTAYAFGQQAQDALARLGGTPADVVAKLRSLALTGIPGHAKVHPVCGYLVLCVPRSNPTLYAAHVAVGPFPHRWVCELPEQVRVAVAEIDAELYPDLLVDRRGRSRGGVDVA